MMQDTSIIVRLTTSQKRALQDHAEIHSTTVSSLIRRAADAAVKGQLGGPETRRGLVASRQAASALFDLAKDLKVIAPESAAKAADIAETLTTIAREGLAGPK
jgi:hypothetical protein